MTVKFVSFGTKQYTVVADSRTGTALIIRHSDDSSTLRMTCSEGFEDYRALKRAWRESRQEFHRLCAEQTYYPERSV